VIELARMGSFFVGGRRVQVTGREGWSVSLSPALTTHYDPNGHFLIESAYVQYFLPARPRFETPLLLSHGGGLTGAQWEDTPDGRPGWLTRFLEAGIACYVIDNVERGRAGFCSIEGEWPDKPIIRSDEEAARFYRFDPPGHMFPMDAIDGLSAQTVPCWPSTQQLQIDALCAAIDRIGPVVIVGFSQGGGLAFRAADRRRTLTRACVGVEPHGVPTGFAPGIPGTPAMMMLGDFIETDEYWRDMASRGSSGLAAWQEAGGTAEVIALPEHGVHGNTHMMMMDTNSDEVFQVLLSWLDRQHAEGYIP
jgi:pimeloyl-ACP methyl ester carboxylesterase